MIFTLPLNLELLFSEPLSCFLAVVAPLLLGGDAPLQSFEAFLGFAIVTGILTSVASLSA